MAADPDLSAAVLEALAVADTAVKAAIRAEITAMITAQDALIDGAARRLRDALAALTLPEQLITDMDAEISRVQARTYQWQSQAGDDRAETRIEARIRLAEWQRELDQLRAKRVLMGDDLAPFLHEREAARDALAAAQARRTALEINLAMPYFGAGQLTEAYRMFRVGSWGAWMVLLSGDRDHAEHDALLAGLDEIAAASGYRTDDLAARIRARAQQEARQSIADTATEPLPPSPSGQDVLALDRARIENGALQGRPTRIDDYRRAPVPPAAREYMQAQRLSEVR